MQPPVLQNQTHTLFPIRSVHLIHVYILHLGNSVFHWFQVEDLNTVSQGRCAKCNDASRNVAWFGSSAASRRLRAFLRYSLRFLASSFAASEKHRAASRSSSAEGMMRSLRVNDTRSNPPQRSFPSDQISPSHPCLHLASRCPFVVTRLVFCSVLFLNSDRSRLGPPTRVCAPGPAR